MSYDFKKVQIVLTSPVVTLTYEAPVERPMIHGHIFHSKRKPEVYQGQREQLIITTTGFLERSKPTLIMLRD